eukprot:1221999-Pleurochrysis_carterae.AAC.1
MRRRRAIRCPMRRARRQTTEEFAGAVATWSRWLRYALRGDGQRSSDHDGRRRARAALPGCEISGVFGRRTYLRRAHTSGGYPAVGGKALWMEVTPRIEHSGARRA